MLSILVLAKLATIVTEPMLARPGVTLVVELMHITHAGRTWLEGQAQKRSATTGRAYIRYYK
jgi:hypothetical protein